MSKVQHRSIVNIDLAAVIITQRQRLRELIDTRFGLLRELLALRVINLQQFEIIQTQIIDSQRTDKLLDHVICLSHAQQRNFLLALYKTGQTHVNNFLLANGHRTQQDGENWPLSEDRKFDNLINRQPELSKTVDMQNGLLDELLAEGCINEEQKQFIEVRSTNAARFDRLLSILFRRSIDDYNKFVGCLAKTKQTKAANLLDPGAMKGQLPLSEVQTSRLVRNRSVLVKLIDSRQSFVAQLHADDCITWQQKKFIETAISQSERNKRLLDMMQRGSQHDFNKFLQYLEATGQKHVCNILNTDPAVALMVTKTEYTRTLMYSRLRSVINYDKKKCVTENERRIVQQFMTLLSNSSDEDRIQLYDHMFQIERELHNRGVQPIAAIRHSIELYFICTSLDGLFYLDRLHSSGELKVLLSSLFDALLDNGRCVIVRGLMWDISNYVECARHLCSGAGLVHHREMYQMLQYTLDVSTSSLSVHPALSIDLLSTEVKELLLFKSAGQLYIIFNKLTPRAGMYTLILLSSVSKPGWQTISSRSFYLRSLRQHCTHVCHPFKRLLQLLESLHVDNIVNGIAEFNKRLFIICEGSATVRVFNSSLPFNQVETFEVWGLTRPIDIVVCSDTSQLYIAGFEQCAIWRVNLLSYKQVDKFISTQWEPWSLSTKSRRLLITPHDGDALFIYGDDGIFLKHIKLPHYMIALHAVETTHNTYIVSHWSRQGDDPLKHESVSEIDINGRVVRTFNSQHNDIGSIQFNKPLYLALADNNHVIVADTRNERIVVLNEDLKLKRVLINSSHGQQPLRLCLSQRTGLLFVAMYQSNDIHVHDVLQA